MKLGAPVKIKGIQIGTVAQISLRLRRGQGELRQVPVTQRPMVVVIEMEESELGILGGVTRQLTHAELNGLIREGLRARLATQSFLTGVLYIEIAFHPGTPAHLWLVPGSGAYPEIPTIPTHLEKIREDAMNALAKISQVDFTRLSDQIAGASGAVKQLAGDPGFHQAIRSISRLVSDPHLQRAVDHLDETLINVNRAVVSVRNTIDRTSTKIDPLIASLQKTSEDLQTALTQADSTLASAELVLRPGSPMTYRLDMTLQELSEASRSVHDLADYLQRNPSALIRGKDVSENQ